MDWKIKFISEEDFTNHVRATIEKYGTKLESFDIKKFNKNIIDENCPKEGQTTCSKATLWNWADAR